jgi:hypothetical protein
LAIKGEREAKHKGGRMRESKGRKKMGRTKQERK